MSYKKSNYRRKNSSNIEKETPHEKIGRIIIEQIDSGNIVFPTRNTQGKDLFKSGNLISARSYSGINTLLTDLSLMSRVDDEKICTEKYGPLLGKALHAKFATFEQLKEGKNGFGYGAFSGIKKETLVVSPRIINWFYKDRKNSSGYSVKWSEKDENGNNRQPTKDEVDRLNLYSRQSQKANLMFSASDMIKKGVEIPKEVLKIYEEKIEKLDINYDEVKENQKLIEAAQEAFDFKLKHMTSMKDNQGGAYDNNTIYIRPMEMYPDTKHFMRILFHEMGHMMGDKNYFDRESLKNYHDSKEIRAKEEMIAEFTSAMVCAHYGIGTDKLGHYDGSEVGNTGYLALWKTVLKDSPDLIRNVVYESQRGAKEITTKIDSVLENKLEPEKKKEVKKTSAPSMR